MDGDIIIADTAEDETAGKCVEIGNLTDSVVVSGLHTMAQRPKFEFGKRYLGVYMNSVSYHKQLLPLMQGIKVISISKTAIASTIIVYPQKIEEQNKIGAIFKIISNLLTLYQRKIGLLQQLKKAMLQRLFPDTDTYPKLRFGGFSGPWEQHKLGELMDVGSVKRIHQSDWKSPGVRFLRARDIVSLSKNEEPSDVLYIDKHKYDEYSEVSGKVDKGDLLVTGVGSIGVPLLIKSSNPLYFKDGNIIWFKNGNVLNGYFFYYSFISTNIQSFIQKSSGIGTVGTYTIDNGKKTPILVPKDKKEQNQIGLFFNQLDSFIALQQRKLDNMNKLKKFMLQQMFI